MSALAGVDIALWDLKGSWAVRQESSSTRESADRTSARKLGVPIYQLLGGKLRDQLKVYAWIGGDRPGDVEKQALVPFGFQSDNVSMWKVTKAFDFKRRLLCCLLSLSIFLDFLTLGYSLTRS
jgi:hypothetical protein